MAKPKFDYDGDIFYKEIYALAMQGLTDAEIAFNLGDNLGVAEDGSDLEIKGLRPTTFSEMKAGKYKGWSKAENERRSARISEELAHGRARTLGIVRGRYLKAALGGIKIKGTTTRKRYQVVDGKEDTSHIIMETVESVQETPPNLQALANFLYHHDKSYRDIQRGLEEGDVNIIVKNGVSIDKWLERENDIEKEQPSE